MHRGRPALGQGEEVKMWRDSDRDGGQDADDPCDTGMFGINIHAGGSQPEMGESAGCQVIAGGWQGGQWLRCYRLIETHFPRRYCYTLCDGAGQLKWAGDCGAATTKHPLHPHARLMAALPASKNAQ